uniref:Hyaluronidase n=1 Tax=Talaromyces funiculosus TaxID=28572 RepID=E7FI86_TALFU|nr:hyaluronidase [Talaromyces funiculosus]
MKTSTLAAAVCQVFLGTRAVAYTLHWDVNSSNFLDYFVFDTEADPTAGFVKYVDQSTASNDGLYSTSNNQIYLGVDKTTVLDSSSTGRNSVRVYSQNTFSSGILITDFAHLPVSVCGIWPAYWTINNQANPYGEIDIMEAYDDVAGAYVSLHTSNTCTLSNRNFTGTDTRTDCTLSSGGGCGVQSTSSQFGAGFNAAGGGVWVLSLENSLQLWVFPRNQIPADITNGSPNPSSWGTPLFEFDSNNGCDVSSNFIDQTVIFNLDFCGQNGAGGQEWSDWTDCATTTGQSTCNAYVAANPSAYSETYFSINSIKLYQ